MLHTVPGKGVGLRSCRAEGRFDGEGGFHLHQRFLALAVGDEIGNRHLLELMFFRKGSDLRSARHGAVVIDEFADDTDRRQACQLAEVDGGFRMSRAHQDAALTGNQRENVSRPGKIGGSDIWIGEIAHRQRAVIGGNARCGAVLEIDADGEGRGMGAVIFGHHGIEVQALGFFARHGGADDA